MKTCMTGSPEIVSLWHKICDEQEDKKNNWIKELRGMGFKASHPNDGWVNRESLEVFFAYPQFNDGANIGDSVMLGWPYDEKSLRPIKLIGKRKTMTGGTWWKFEDLNQNNTNL